MSYENYLGQMKLLVRLLPIVLKNSKFALKGGTAINLFYRNLPRISVDIDLVYLPIEDRATSFKNIHSILQEIKSELEAMPAFRGISITSSNPLDGKKETKLIAKLNSHEVKIEPNYILRGALNKPVNKTLCQKAQDLTLLENEIQCVSLEDLYAGKICAALDRQHSRDLFDVKILMENEGISKEIKNAFLFYLISNNRPMIELLNPNLVSIERSFSEEFQGMHDTDIAISELEKTRKDLIAKIQSSLTERDKEFLLSIVNNNPQWDHAPFPDMLEYPSIKWKLYNISKMTTKKRSTNHDQLKAFLD